MLDGYELSFWGDETLLRSVFCPLFAAACRLQLRGSGAPLHCGMWAVLHPRVLILNAVKEIDRMM